jgi:4-aminobutyrate aminotransferase-like enzyme
MSHSKSHKIWDEQGGYILPATKFIEPVLQRGEGSYVWDVDGNKYLDLNGGQFCLCFGHAYPALTEAVIKQMGNIIHTNTNTISSIVFDALQELIEINNEVFKAGILLSTGAEAVEFALRFSKSIKKSNKMIYLNEGYHGSSLGAQSVSSYGKWAFPTVDETFGVSVPRTTSEIGPCVEKIEQIFRENPKEIAALIMEPILGAGGMIFPSADFLKKVRELCDKYKAILIFDECQTGFGRTGSWFCYQKYNVSPDILVFAKAGGAGMPVSGVLFVENLAEEMRSGNLTHFASHQNDPLSAAITLFVIEEIKKKNILEKVGNSGEIFLDKITEISTQSDVIVNPRGVGLMIAFDINEDLFDREKNPGHELMNKLLSRGIIIQCINRGRTFRIIPNFLISTEEIDFFIEKLNESLNEFLNE